MKKKEEMKNKKRTDKKVTCTNPNCKCNFKCVVPTSKPKCPKCGEHSAIAVRA